MGTPKNRPDELDYPLNEFSISPDELESLTMHANGTWVEFTAFREQDDGEVLHLNKATGVIVDGWVREMDDALMYTVQHYEGNEPVPEPSRYVCHAALVEALDKPPLRVLPGRAAAERP